MKWIIQIFIPVQVIQLYYVTVMYSHYQSFYANNILERSESERISDEHAGKETEKH